MPVKETFTPSFGGGFSANDPNLVSADDLNSYLGADPDDVTYIKKDTKPDPKNTTDPKDSTDPKEKATPAPVKKELSVDEIDLFADDSEEEEDKNPEDSEEDDINNPLKKKTPAKPETKEPEEKEESIYATLTKDLLSSGVFTPDEDEEGNTIAPEINTGEDFLKQFQKEVRKQTGQSIQKFLSQFGEDYQEMFDAVYVNGVPPLEYISRQVKIDNINEYDITTEDNQEKIVRLWYKTEGRTAEAIEARIQKIKNYGDLEDEAKEAKSVLVGKEQKDLQNLALQKQQALQAKHKEKADYVNNVHRILSEKLKIKDFDGIPVEKKFVQETMDYLTKDVYKLKDNSTLTEFDKDILDLNRPENNVNKVKIAMLLQILKKDPTLSKLGKKAVSKETDKLFNEMERKFGKSKPAPKVSTEVSSSNW